MICDQNFGIKKGDYVQVKCHERFKSGVVFIIVNSPVSISQNNKVSRGGKWAHKTARPRELQGASPPDPRQIITIIWNGLLSEFQNTKICVKYESGVVIAYWYSLSISQKIVLAESQNNLMKLLEAVSFRGLRPLTPDKLLPWWSAIITSE